MTWTEIQEKFSDDASRHLIASNQANTTAQKILRALDAASGGKWVNVSKVNKEFGECYVVRRVYLFPRKSKPSDLSIAEWTELGWRTIEGLFGTTTAQSTVEIFIKRTK